jgi:hypothetical protein
MNRVFSGRFCTCRVVRVASVASQHFTLCDKFSNSLPVVGVLCLVLESQAVSPGR